MDANKLTSNGASALFAKLRGVNSTIKMVRFDSNNIGDECIHSLGEYLRDNRSIERMSISDNGITDKGVKVLSEYLIGNVNLKELNLDANVGITESSVPYLTEIAKMSTIHSIKLDRTSISDQSKIELFNHLQIPPVQREIPINPNMKSTLYSKSTTHAAISQISKGLSSTVKISNNCSIGLYNQERCLCEVHRTRGKYIATMGMGSGSAEFESLLFPEEAVFLSDREELVMVSRIHDDNNQEDGIAKTEYEKKDIKEASGETQDNSTNATSKTSNQKKANLNKKDVSLPSDSVVEKDEVFSFLGEAGIGLSAFTAYSTLREQRFNIFRHGMHLAKTNKEKEQLPAPRVYHSHTSQKQPSAASEILPSDSQNSQLSTRETENFSKVPIAFDCYMPQSGFSKKKMDIPHFTLSIVESRDCLPSVKSICSTIDSDEIGKAFRIGIVGDSSLSFVEVAKFDPTKPTNSSPSS